MAKIQLPVDTDTQEGPRERIFDPRSLLAALLIAVFLVTVAMLWRMATQVGALRAPEEFQFSLGEHSTEKFELRDPMRQFIKEKPSESLNAVPAAVIREERPNIQVSENPAANTEGVTEVIKSRNVEFNTEKIEVSGTGNVEIADTPMEISQVSETVTYALNPIAAETLGAADIFKYDHPSPRDRVSVYHINSGPRPGRAVSNALPKAFGDQDAPTIGKLGSASINLFGTGDFFRTMDRAGTIRARSAVDSALHWLAAHQDSDGLWDASKYSGNEDASLADTGLACLALMSAGNTTAKGEYRRTVLRGIEAIIRHQNDKGLITQKGANLYTHAICTIALCESYGRAKDERVRAAAQKAVDFCQVAVNSDSGWRYTPNSPASDTSVTAWFVQALKAAKLAGIDFKSSVMSQALVFIDAVTDDHGGPNSSGNVYYMNGGEDGVRNGNSSPALTAAAMMIRRFNGMSPSNALLRKGAENTRAVPPDWKHKDFYFWYYATYAMHNMGGEYRIWWNAKIRDLLLEHQAKDGDNAGSWDPKDDHWAGRGGRVYTTALGALCLEVYYRYSDALNTFGTAVDLDELFLDNGGK